MNLYELAKSLESWASDVYGGGKTITDSANMLRQQQVEIETLRIQLQIVSKNLHMGISKSIQKAQAKAIDEVLNES